MLYPNCIMWLSLLHLYCKCGVTLLFRFFGPCTPLHLNTTHHTIIFLLLSPGFFTIEPEPHRRQHHGTPRPGSQHLRALTAWPQVWPRCRPPCDTLGWQRPSWARSHVAHRPRHQGQPPAPHGGPWGHLTALPTMLGKEPCDLPCCCWPPQWADRPFPPSITPGGSIWVISCPLWSWQSCWPSAPRKGRAGAASFKVAALLWCWVAKRVPAPPWQGLGTSLLLWAAKAFLGKARCGDAKSQSRGHTFS